MFDLQQYQPITDLFVPSDINFSEAIINGNLAKCKWILKNNPNILQSFGDTHIYTKYLYYHNTNISNTEFAFIGTCEKGHLHIAQWLLQIKPDLRISAENNTAFRWTCNRGHLQIAKLLLQIKPDIDISANNELDFRCACYNGHLHVAQWLLQIKPNINISANNEQAFRLSCYNGHLHMAQWLLQIKPDIDISAENEYAFRWACGNGYLHVAQWLLQIKPDIDVSANEDDTFRYVCEYSKQLYIAKWLTTLCPRYTIIDTNTEPIEYHIDKKQYEPITYLLFLHQKQLIYRHNKCIMLDICKYLL
tara:strand:+ start:82 stop:996 length:915 start_codon:yes stop_codon:yes gene_type:complete